MTISTQLRKAIVTITCCITCVQAQQDNAARDTLRLWVETMQKRQLQQEDWKRDLEVLTNYKEGLSKEIEELKKFIADAKNRAAAEDKENVDLTKKIEAYQQAQQTLGTAVRDLETRAIAQAKSLPTTLLKEARTSQLLTEITKDVALTGDKQNDGLPKRLNNVLSLLGESEKWQQTTHIKEEVHKLKDGREMNLTMLYIGLSAAYGVAPEAKVAIVGSPTPNGWDFKETPDQFDAISQAIAATKGDVDPAFITLPVSKP